MPKLTNLHKRGAPHVRPAGHPTLEASAAELAAIFKNTTPTGKRGRPATPLRHLDADLRYCHHLRGERSDTAGRSFDICRTLHITHHGKTVAEATITRVEALPHFTRVHFIAPTHVE